VHCVLEDEMQLVEEPLGSVKRLGLELRLESSISPCHTPTGFASRIPTHSEVI
jgi:hypothetical protein